MKPESLVRTPLSEIWDTLGKLCSLGVTADDLANRRQDPSVMLRLAEILKFGDLVRSRLIKIQVDSEEPLESLQERSGLLCDDDRMKKQKTPTSKRLPINKWITAYLLNFPVNIESPIALEHIKAMGLLPGALELQYILEDTCGGEFVNGEKAIVLLGSPIFVSYPGRILYPYIHREKDKKEIWLPLEPEHSWNHNSCSFLAYTTD